MHVKNVFTNNSNFKLGEKNIKVEPDVILNTDIIGIRYHFNYDIL